MSCFEPPIGDIVHTPADYMMAVSEEPEAPPQEPAIMFPKLMRRDECTYIERARSIMSELTGEQFEIAEPEWLSFGGVRLQCDGVNARIKIMLNYVGTNVYGLPPDSEYMYHDAMLYGQFLHTVNTSRIIAASMAGYAICDIPGGLTDADLRTHLSNWQHWLTGYRVWVGAPLCKCPSLMCPQK